MMKSDSSPLDRHSKAWSSVIGQLSHSLVTKLATLRMKHRALQDVLPELINGYRLAVEQNLMKSDLTQYDLQVLDDTANIEEQVGPMLDLLESVNAYCNQLRKSSSAIQLLSARVCVNEVLGAYPFENDEQRNLIKFEQESDFEFYCSPIFITALMNNLLSNGLMSVKKAGHGEIHIWISEDEHGCIINVKDTGLGMNERTNAKVFGHTLSTRNEQTEPGLGLCRLAIQHAGGDIICHAVNGQYAHFQIMLPRLEDKRGPSKESGLNSHHPRG